MKKTGATLAVHALEALGIEHTFGIPGVHNTELYDALGASDQIDPLLVTHEGGGAFMADGVSRTSDQTGTLVIVPAAGTTHAMSGVGEAFLDGIPMLVISGGIRRDTGRHYQLHDVDQARVLDGLIKQYTLVESHDEVIPSIYDAYRTAHDGEPGPVFVEIPAEIQLFRGAVESMPAFEPDSSSGPAIEHDAIERAVDLLTEAEQPGLYVSWGAVDAADETTRLAEQLVAPIATTLQGKSAVPAHHPLHTGVGFGPSAVPAAQNAFADCDTLLAVGTRFAELATGSYGMDVPDDLVHVDINPEVFDKNYPTTIAIEGDARRVLRRLLDVLQARDWTAPRRREDLADQIRQDKTDYREQWTDVQSDTLVSPGPFFDALRSRLDDDAQLVVDDGKHTFLAAELFPVQRPRGFLSPTDFNCMGYCVPAAIGAKLANPERQVAAVVGDGAFLMTGMELLTAAPHDLGVMAFVFHDGELGQISQFQSIPLNRKTCTELGDMKIEGVAEATGAHYVRMETDADIEPALDETQSVAETGRPVIVDVNIDYRRRTQMTTGVVKTNLSRFSTSEKIRFVARAAKRHLLG
ncbi:MAG: thiamine pyrophosphate-binding protein [Salinibacter sp.]